MLSGGYVPGTYSLADAYRLSPWLQPSIHAFAGVVAARTFRVNQGKSALDRHWLIDLISRPNRTLRMSEYQLLYYTAALWRYSGQVFWELEYGDARPGADKPRGGKPRPTDIWIWNRDAVTPDINPSTREFRGWFVTWNGMRKWVDRLDMIDFPLFDPTQHNPHGPSPGRSLWDAKRLPIANEIKQHQWNADFFGRGVAPTVAFIDKNATADSPNVNKDEFMAHLKAKVVGKNGEPIYLGGDWVVQQLEASQRDAQFIEGLEQNRKIIQAGNVPPIVLGDNDANYANADAQILAWLTFDVIPAMSFMCSCIDTGFLYDEPGLWAELSVHDIDALQEGMGKRIERYTQLVNMRHSPKVASQMVGIDVDPEMPGYGDVMISFAQIPYDVAAEGQSVSASKAAADNPPADATPAAPPAPEPATPARSGASPLIRIVRELPERIAPRASRATVGTLDILGTILEIVTRDTKKVRDRAAQFQLQAVTAGAKQLGDVLGVDSIIAIDDPRVTAFLTKRGNLITSVPEGVAERISSKVVSLVDKGTSPEDIGTILRKDFNILSNYKARQIARQEVGSGLNGGRYIEMQESGVDKREWLSSRDEIVRESHAPGTGVDGEVIGIDDKYSNGLRYPQDPDGDNEEVQGCRCIDLMVIGSASRFFAAMRAIASREIALAAAQDEVIDEREGYWRAVVNAKDVRNIERRLASAMSAIINDWRAPILKALADMGVMK